MLIQCSECGAPVSDKATACLKCGNPISRQTKCEKSMTKDELDSLRFNLLARDWYLKELSKSEKSRVVYTILGLTLGLIGVHNFYIGDKVSGILQLMLFIFWFFLCAICPFEEVDIIVISLVLFLPLVIWVIVNLCKTTTDRKGRTLT